MNKLRHSRAQMQVTIDKLRKQVKGQQETMAKREAALQEQIDYLTQRTSELAGELEQARYALKARDDR